MTLDDDFHICKTSNSPGTHNSFKKCQVKAAEVILMDSEEETWYFGGRIVA